MHAWLAISPAILIIGIILLGGCISAQPVHPDISSGIVQEPSPPARELKISVDDLGSGSVLPDVYTCKGAGESPPMHWDGIPAGSKTLVIILEDLDAPGGRFTHWILYNIPPIPGDLAPAQPRSKVLANGAQQGDTSTGSRGYYPPCPPVGTTHRYLFRLFAVDMDIVQPSADRDSIDWALTDHTIGTAELVTKFTR